MISGINNQSFGVQRSSGGSASIKPPEDNGSLPTDGVQLSGGVEQPTAAGEAPAKATVRMEITKAELATQGFRQTMAALASAGVPVEVVLVAEKALTSETPSAPKETQSSVNLNANQGFIAQPPPTPSRPAAAAAPSHRTPSYGSD